MHERRRGESVYFLQHPSDYRVKPRLEPFPVSKSDFLPAEECVRPSPVSLFLSLSFSTYVFLIIDFLFSFSLKGKSEWNLQKGKNKDRTVRKLNVVQGTRKKIRN